MINMDPPIIEQFSYNEYSLEEFGSKLTNTKQKLLVEYPTLYIHEGIANKDKYSYEVSPRFDVYVGETNNILRRTKQHLNDKNKSNSNGQIFKDNVIVIGHSYFNKSLTLDLENKLMHYLMGVKSVKTLRNSRTNPQNDYYTSEHLDNLFTNIWEKLNQKYPSLFPSFEDLKEQAIFKASPFHKLTEEQQSAKELIISKVKENMKFSETGNLIFVSGEAGSGKTVLLSSLFLELNKLSDESNELTKTDESDKLSTFLLVNHNEQLSIYERIVEKLDLTSEYYGISNVKNPTSYINAMANLTNSNNSFLADVVLIDEAHLLWTQGKQSYTGKNQLYDILKTAKVVVMIFDEKQILRTNQYWEKDDMKQLQDRAKEQGNYIHLMNQMRMHAGEETMDWLKNFIDDRKIKPIPINDKNGYEITVFKSPEDLHHAIKEKSNSPSTRLSRILATYDWEYKKSSPEDKKYWSVSIGNWSIPWNLETQKENKNYMDRGLSWAEKDFTINEAGSTYTIQGSDLNYAGVIIGPSVKYRNNKIIFDREASENRDARMKRTLKDGSKEYLADELLRNELNVLLTRGIDGLYIYAVDEELQNALLNASKEGKNN